MGQRPHVIIAGAGYAGLSALLALAPEARAGGITLSVVNATDAHLVLPELPLFLAGEEDTGQVRLSLSFVVRPPARLVLSQVRSVETAPPALVCADPVGRLAADGLILALGSVASGTRVPGVKEHALSVERWDDVLELRRRLLRGFRHRAHGAAVVVGGGYTGVEIATELASVRNARTGVTLVAPHVLPGMPSAVRGLTTRALRHLAVPVVRAHVGAVEDGAAVLQSGRRLPADTVIWAAGVHGSPAVQPLPRNRKGQARVDACLRAAPFVYCAGDCAAATDAGSGKAVATTAQAAMAEGALAAGNLLRELRGDPPQHYQDHPMGLLVSLGRGEAAGLIGRHVVHGRDVAALKHLIEAYHAFQIGGLRALGLRLRQAAAAALHP